MSLTMSCGLWHAAFFQSLSSSLFLNCLLYRFNHNPVFSLLQIHITFHICVFHLFCFLHPCPFCHTCLKFPWYDLCHFIFLFLVSCHAVFSPSFYLAYPYILLRECWRECILFHRRDFHCLFYCQPILWLTRGQSLAHMEFVQQKKKIHISGTHNSQRCTHPLHLVCGLIK